MHLRSRITSARPRTATGPRHLLIGGVVLAVLATFLGVVAAAPAQAGPLTSSTTPRVAALPQNADPTVLGIDLVDFNGQLQMVFDTNAFTHVQYSYTLGAAGWGAWQAIQASGIVGWPHTDDDGPPYDYWPNFVIAMQTSDDGGASWSQLRYVILELDNAAEGNQPTITVADNALWIAVRDANNLVNHPDDPYGDPFRLADRLWSCGTLQTTDCIELVQYRQIGDPNWTPAALPQPLDPTQLPPDITHYDPQQVNPTSLEYWSTPGVNHESGNDEVWLNVFIDNSTGTPTPRIQGSLMPRGAEVPRAGIFQCDAQGNWDPAAGQQCLRTPRLNLGYEYDITLRLSTITPAMINTRVDNIAFSLTSAGADWLVSVSGSPRRGQFIVDNSQPWTGPADDENYEFDFLIDDFDANGIDPACEGSGLLVGNSNGNGSGFGYDPTSMEVAYGAQARTFDVDGTTPWAGEFEAYLSGSMSECTMQVTSGDAANVSGLIPGQPNAQYVATYDNALDAIKVAVTNFEYAVPFGLISRITSGPPDNVTADPGDSSITATWDTPVYPGRAAITGYRATATPGGAFCTTTGALTCDIDGLTNGQSYRIAVVAINSAGDGLESPFTGPVTPQSSGGGGGDGVNPIITFDPPGAPGTPVAVVDDTTVTLTWTAPAYTGTFPITAYTATVSPQGLTCTTVTTTCTITGLTSGTASSARVTASSAAGVSAPSLASEPFTATAPPAPDEPAAPEPDEPATIIITGTRAGGKVLVRGITTGMGLGAVLTPYLTFAGKATQPGARTVAVDDAGAFTWGRKTTKALAVTFTTGEVSSNEVRFRPRSPRPPTRR